MDIKNEKGQALLFVVATMVAAMALGVGISLRTLSSVSRVTSTDTASRALAAAEGGAERYLALPTDDLDDIVDKTDTYCPAGTTQITDAVDPYLGWCRITFSPVDPDKITAIATVDVSAVGATGNFEFTAPKNQVVEVNLNTYTGGNNIKICWSTIGSSTTQSDIYYVAYGGSPGNYKTVRGGLESNNPVGGLYSTNFDWDSAGCGSGTTYSWQGTANLGSTPTGGWRGLRIISINYDSRVAIRPDSGNLPSQGYMITSVGQLQDSSAQQKVVKTVKVFRSLPYLPAPFNFAVYTEGSL